MSKFLKGKEQPERRIHSAPRVTRKTVGLSRIGIFPGTFDPVHAGHLAFALQAMKQGKLDRIIFLPERQPRGQKVPEHFGHRTAMLTRAIRPYKKFSILELPDIYFDVPRTLPKLQKEFAGAELVILMGSDTLLRMNFQNWPAKDLKTFLSQTGLAVGIRAEHDSESIKTAIKNLPERPKSCVVFQVSSSQVSSSKIRRAFRHNLPAAGLLPSVRRYAKAEWLYASLPTE